MLSYLLELFFVVSWFAVLPNVKAGPPLQWVNGIPILILVFLYAASLALRIVAEGKRRLKLELAGYALFALSLFGRPVASWLTSG